MATCIPFREEVKIEHQSNKNAVVVLRRSPGANEEWYVYLGGSPSELTPDFCVAMAASWDYAAGVVERLTGKKRSLE